MIDISLSGIRLYWWRAIKNGAIILQNELTGRLIVIPNKYKRLTGVADTTMKCLSFIRRFAVLTLESQRSNFDKFSNVVGGTFFIKNPKYPMTADLSTIKHIFIGKQKKK